MADPQRISHGENSHAKQSNELIKKSILTEDGNPARYRLQTTTDNLNQSKSYRKISFGERDEKKRHKIILMVGETGTGKTTLINAMINYICGVKREDKVWFEITDDQNDPESVHSQTSDVIIYGVYLQETSVDLTIIDTPGYGDTRGADRDREIAESFQHICTSEDVMNQINAVCFVMKADQYRLSDRQHCIFDAVQSLFGKDIADNIVLLFTHSDGAPPKNALTAVKEAEVKCAVDEMNQPIYFLFNNCQEETFDEEEQTIQDQAWNLSFRGMTEFFKFLDMTQSKSLQMTKNVLKKQKELEPNISHLQLHVQKMELKQNKLKQTEEDLEKNKEHVKENNSGNTLNSINQLCSTDELKRKSIKIEDGNPARYRLQTTTDNLNQSKSYRKITFGEKDENKPHKIILMVGETGTGKTTLINTMINYICGVQRKDKVWFEITDDQSDRSSAHSQTSIITVYGVYIQETSVDLTIIDTPGYGHTHDINFDQKIVKDLLGLYTSEDRPHEINAVCLVCNSSYTRLSKKQLNIFDAVQSLFGKDIADNIVLLFTHSDGAPPKNALKAVKTAEIKCAVDEKKNQPIYFLFNNRQEETFDEDYQIIYDQAWDLSYRGMTEFFKFLSMIKPKTLELTRDVLIKHKQFQPNIFKLQSHVQKMKEKQNELKQTEEDLEKHKQDVKENNNFEYEVEVSYKEKVDIDPAVAKKATTCPVCKENCHYPGCWWICDISGCSVMKNDHCTVCTNKCHYTKHVKEDKIYVTKTKTETRTYEDLKKKYEDKIKDRLSMINKLKNELQELEKEKTKLVIKAYNCVESLEMIALNTESLFKLLHIDFLIEKLKEINEPEKAEALENIRKKAGNTILQG
ncbi:uncharacterized protein [Misgurnus anguillicaudatus]|uniref:uncharacterized protein n=1 Tax=Misgurnus anguillicaudatus TaxID=75329 RepID=UPI003CCF36DC